MSGVLSIWTRETEESLHEGKAGPTVGQVLIRSAELWLQCTHIRHRIIRKFDVVTVEKSLASAQ